MPPGGARGGHGPGAGSIHSGMVTLFSARVQNDDSPAGLCSIEANVGADGRAYVYMAVQEMGAGCK